MDHDNRAHAKLIDHHEDLSEKAGPQLTRQAYCNDLERETPKQKASEGSDGWKAKGSMANRKHLEQQVHQVQAPQLCCSMQGGDPSICSQAHISPRLYQCFNRLQVSCITVKALEAVHHVLPKYKITLDTPPAIICAMPGANCRCCCLHLCTHPLTSYILNRHAALASLLV